MVFVDGDGRRFAELSDYIADDPVSISALTGQFVVWWSAATNGREVRAYATNPIGNSTLNTFVINGAGKPGVAPVGSNSTSGALISQMYDTDAAGDLLLARIQGFLSANFGGDFAAQFPSLVNNTVVTGLPGAIRIGVSDWWGKGQAWQTVHPLFQTPSSAAIQVPAGDDGEPPYSRLGWQWDFYTGGGADAAWLRWRKFGQFGLDPAVNVTQWPIFRISSVGKLIPEANVTIDQTQAYIRCTTHDGVGYTSATSATDALGLTSPASTFGRHFGNAKGIDGLSRVTLIDTGNRERLDEINNITWDGITPFRWQLWSNSTESALLTGDDWATSQFTTKWMDVEVYPVSAVGPELPTPLETLVADTLPRVTSRLRVRVGLDGGPF